MISLGELFYYIRGNSEKLDSDIDQSEGKMLSFGDRLASGFDQAVSVAMGNIMAQGINQVAAGIENLGESIVGAAADAETVVAQFENAATNLRDFTEENKKILEENATSLSAQFGIDDEDLLDAETKLMRYRDISVDSYKEILTAAADMSAATGKAVGSSTQTIAMAMTVPTRAVGILRRAGIVLTETERDMLKVMQETGQLAEAQTFILGKLQQAYGGAAAAAADTFAGSQQKVAVAMENIREALGDAFLPLLKELLDILADDVLPVVQDLVSGFKDLPEPVRWAMLALGGLLIGAVKLIPTLTNLVALIRMIRIGGIAGAAGTAAEGLGGFWGMAAGAKAATTGVTILGTSFSSLGAALAGLAAPIAIVVAGFAAIKLAYDTNFLGLKDALDTWPGIIENFKIIVNKLMENLVLDMKKFGKESVTGFSSGFEFAWKYFQDRVGRLVANLINGVRRALNLNGIPAPAFAGAGSGGTSLRSINQSNITVGTVEYHGSFSDEEREWFERQSEENALAVIARTLE